MGRITRTTWVGLTLVAALAGCNGTDDTTQRTTPTIADTETPSPETTPTPELAEVDDALEIEGEANIFAAGLVDISEIGVLGGGEAPPGWGLPSGARVVTFPRIDGRVAQVPGAPLRGPGGRNEGRTDIGTPHGISGIAHQRNIMFLVGVFLTDSLPSEPAPPSLDVTKPPRGTVEPSIAQVFLIGDGKGVRVAVPDGATRLFVGFADACHPTNFVGAPGCYYNNTGELKVSVKVSS